MKKLRIYIESKMSVCPVKGMEDNGRNGIYFCYRSINTYSEGVCKALIKDLSEHHGIDAITYDY